MMINSPILLIAVIFIVAVFGTKIIADTIANKVNIQVYQIFDEVFDNTADDDIKKFKLKNTHQTVILLKVIVGALSDTIHYFKDEYDIETIDLSEMCMKFALQRSKDHDINITPEAEKFINKVINVYLQKYVNKQ